MGIAMSCPPEKLTKQSVPLLPEQPSKHTRIVMFCPQFRPLIGGAERQAELLSSELARAGYEILILTPKLDLTSPGTEYANGVQIERFPLLDLSLQFPIPGVAAVNIPYILWQIARAVRLKLKSGSILHCHSASLQTAGAALAGRMKGTPVICKAATAGERSDLGKIKECGPSGTFVAWLVRSLVTTWIATTAAVGEALERAGVPSDRISHIPNGVALKESKRRVASSNGARRFLYLGRVSAACGRDFPTVIKAFERIALRDPRLELAIVGGGDLLEKMRNVAKQSQVCERIYLPGFDDPDKWLGWADCFVLPSVREGLSNALLEALAEGLPCIANDIPPNREVLENGQVGMLVPVGNVQALEEAMKAMATDDSLAAHYSSNARRRVKQTYSIEAVAFQYSRLYATLGITSSFRE